jgi:hypothetical protein
METKNPKLISNQGIQFRIIYLEIENYLLIA